MEKNEIKKAVYKTAPAAKLQFIRIGNAYYFSEFNHEDELIKATFVVPVSDMGSTDFLPEMEAKFLLRWLE
jgi:hypothetical protein